MVGALPVTDRVLARYVTCLYIFMTYHLEWQLRFHRDFITMHPKLEESVDTSSIRRQESESTYMCNTLMRKK